MAALAAAAVVAVVAIAVTLGVVATGPSPAYAVEHTGAGDIVVTVTRLDDAEGLEQALAEHGIEAEVDYDAELFQRTTTPRPIPTRSSPVSRSTRARRVMSFRCVRRTRATGS